MKKKKTGKNLWLRAQSLALAMALCAGLVGPAVPAFAEAESSGEGLVETQAAESAAAGEESSPAGDSATGTSSVGESVSETTSTEESTSEAVSSEGTEETSATAAETSSAAAESSAEETEPAEEVQPEEYEVLIDEAVEEGQIQDPEQALSTFTLYATVQRGTTTASVNFRYGPGTNYSSMGTIPSGTTMTILGDGKDSNGTVWFLITYNGKQGYVSSAYITLSTMEVGQDAAFEEYMDQQGFPESYQEKLRILHAQYPTWQFVAQDAGSWSEALEAETWFNPNGPSGSGSTQAVSLVSADSISSWKSTEDGAFDWSTGEWVTGWDGDSWVVASDEIVAYYLDPRNFLDESSVFQFLDLSDTNTSTEAISQLAAGMGATWLTGSFNHANGDTINYPQAILDAGKAAGYNPLALVASMIQELGVNGAERETISGTVQGYENLYNYFNIGAFTDDTFSKAYLRGLWIAGGGSSGSTSWGRPWNTRQKAITGGAIYFAQYITDYGQDTLYLKKFDVLSGNYSHQYATNIQMADSEGRILSRAYSEDLRKGTLTFKIPVYSGMPDEACDMPMDDTNPTDPVQQFVDRLYTEVLGRTPVYSETRNWYNYLTSHQMTASDVAAGFVFSAEYKRKNTSNESFVTMLYEALFDRSPRSDEVAFWVEYLEMGVTREFVYAGFANSTAFNRLCSQFGVTQGSYQSGNILDQNPNVTAFVTRMYTTCLQRTGTESERGDWVERLLNHTTTGRTIVYGFFESNEINRQNLSDEEFVRRAYRTILGREPEGPGFSNWLTYLRQGHSRRELLDGFIYSAEFNRLCGQYGIEQY